MRLPDVTMAFYSQVWTDYFVSTGLKIIKEDGIFQGACAAAARALTFLRGTNFPFSVRFTLSMIFFFFGGGGDQELVGARAP